MSNCLVCFKKLNYKGLYSYVFKPCICHDCFKKMNRKPIYKKIDKIKIYTLFPYENDIVSLIYRLKGCNDIALAPIFLSYDLPVLKLIFHSYIIVPAPSYEQKNIARGFNHVEMIFQTLNLPMQRVLYKKKDFKQANLNKAQRKEATNYIGIKKCDYLTNKKILLVDDIITTGYTLSKCVSLLKQLSPKCVKIMTIAYSLSKNRDI